MRKWIDLFEDSATKLYHGSRKSFPLGFTLLPQSDGYIHAERDNPAHAMLEGLLEKYRPDDCIPRDKAVFLVDDPDMIDNAGGYSDYLYTVDPVGPVTKCNLAWYSALYLLCEHEALSAAEAKAMGREWYPEWEEPEMREHALNYWKAAPHGSDDLAEYLCTSAVITAVDF